MSAGRRGGMCGEGRSSSTAGVEAGGSAARERKEADVEERRFGGSKGCRLGDLTRCKQVAKGSERKSTHRCEDLFCLKVAQWRLRWRLGG